MPLDNYIWEKNRRRRNVAIIISAQGELIVKTPFHTPKSVVETFLLQKRDWIVKHQQSQRERIHPELPSYAPCGELFLDGKKIPFVCEAQRPSRVVKVEDQLTVYAMSEALFKKVLTQWYTQLSDAAVCGYLKKYETKIKKTPASISYKRVKRKWGSCDSKNHIMFNSLLAMHSPNHIEYIVVHELAHIEEKHHRASFWEYGEKLLPGFKQLHKDMIK